MTVIYEEEKWKKYREEIEKRIAYYQTAINLIPLDTKSVLDVGCGEGTFLNMLATSWGGNVIVGVDVSLTALRYVKGQKIRASVKELPFKDRSFDLVTCLEVLEHPGQDLFYQAIEEIKRVTRKYIIISVPNEEPLEYFLVVCPACGCHFNAVGHVRSFTSKSIKELFYPQFSMKRLKECGDFIEYPNYNKMIFGALRAYIMPRPPKGSICPQCGYVEKAEKDRISYSQLPLLLKIGKKIADLFWHPKRKRRYLVAFYERSE